MSFIHFFILFSTLFLHINLYSQQGIYKVDYFSKENSEHNNKHFDYYQDDAPFFNKVILKAIDKVQSKGPDGGGYFIGITANPPEAPVNYSLSLFNQPLWKSVRKSSYCSGSTYAVFIEALNEILLEQKDEITDDTFEELRMAEKDWSRREDKVKFWGNWNADGFGNHFALVQYSDLGEEVKPSDARPGDFMNISWKNGGGHSVIFLGWIDDVKGKFVLYWSSQNGTNGYGDQYSDINDIESVKIIRLTNPKDLLNGFSKKEINYKIKGDKIDF